MERSIKVAPSVLSADFARMGEEIKSVELAGADMIHMDVMDGVFVPNITFGIKMVADVRKITKLPLDCHLMIVHPEKYVSEFAKAGADYITVHYEACKESLAETLKLIKSFGVKCGLVINPDTPVSCVESELALCDMVLVMSVFPGFGGQKFIADVLEKCKEIRGILDEGNPSCLLEIDGGINSETAKLAAASGCDVLVAGSSVFGKADRAEAIESLK
jgi:ribulose-phosphate 3-epimerase